MVVAPNTSGAAEKSRAEKSGSARLSAIFLPGFFRFYPAVAKDMPPGIFRPVQVQKSLTEK